MSFIVYFCHRILFKYNSKLTKRAPLFGAFNKRMLQNKGAAYGNIIITYYNLFTLQTGFCYLLCSSTTTMNKYMIGYYNWIANTLAIA